jgi:channel protein (hemolysin III family)
MIDHSAIYLLIAGTYTPFIAQLKMSFASAACSQAFG